MFGKQHKDVMKAIRNLECSPEFHERNFAPVEIIQKNALGAKVDRSYYVITRDGSALLRIRDSQEAKPLRSYRDQFGSFEEYCRERWDFTRMRASQLITSSQVVENVNNCLQPPVREAHCRPLTDLTPEDQQAVWQRVLDSGDKITKKPEVSTQSVSRMRLRCTLRSKLLRCRMRRGWGRGSVATTTK